MYSYAILVGISIVVSLGYSEAYVNCYDCGSDNNPSSNAEVDCFGPDMTKVPKCVGATCVLYSATCSGTSQQCERDFHFSKNTTASVNRFCTNDTIDSDQCASLKFTLHANTYCYCKGDLCNAGPTVKAFPKITLAFLIMSSYVVNLLVQWKDHELAELLDAMPAFDNLLQRWQ